MSANISEINGVPTMAYIGATPWHGLGNIMDDATARDVKAATIAAGLSDWNVDLQQHFLQDGRVNPFSKAVVRGLDGSILGSVGPKTPVVQNEQAFAILEPLTKEFGVTISTAGALGNGSRVWMLAKMGDTKISPVAGDDINGYFLIVHAHDNTHSLDGIPTPIRVVCQNTLMMAVMDAGGIHTSAGRVFKIKKTRNVQNRIDEAAGLMKNFMKTMEQTNESFASMAAKKLDPKGIAQFIESVFPYYVDPKTGKEVDSKVTTERRKTVTNLVFTGQGAEMAGSNLSTGESTVWAVYNAITEYFDHVRPAEAKSDSAKAKATVSAIFGANAAVKMLALKQARQLVAAA